MEFVSRLPRIKEAGEDGDQGESKPDERHVGGQWSERDAVGERVTEDRRLVPRRGDALGEVQEGDRRDHERTHHHPLDRGQERAELVSAITFFLLADFQGPD